MKKSSLIILATIVLALLLAVSCNSDTEHGLYYQLASSSEASNISVTQYLYTEDGNYVYLNDKGIWAFDGTSHNPLYKSTETMKIAYGACSEDGDVYYLDKNGKLYLNGEKFDKATESYQKLFSGYLVKLNGAGIDIIADSDEAPTSIFTESVTNVMESNGYIAFNSGDYTYVYDGKDKVFKEAKFDFTGFVAENDENLYFTRGSELYKGIELVKSYTDPRQDNGIPMFIDNSNVYLKMQNLFKDVTGNKDVTRGWANNLATANVIYAQDGYIGSTSSGLYKIDIEENTNQKIF